MLRQKQRMITPKDQKILNALIENSRASSREIARKTGMSAVTVLSHMKDLEKKGIIRQYTSHLDYEKLGYDVQAIVNIRISKGRFSELAKKVAPLPGVFAIYDITGHFDALIITKFKNRRSLDGFLKKIQAFEFVERTETELVLNTIKEQNILVE